MSYNGSGTFVINTAGQPVVSGTVISSTAFNALTADLATGLSTAITKDGQTTPTANIPMGNNKITGLAVGTAATDAANLSQVQSTVAKLVNSVSGVDTITGTMSPTLAAYAAGQMFYFVAAGDNTGAVTLNLDGLGAKAVTRDGSVALAAGDIKSGEVVVVVYDGTRFQVVSQLNSAGNATFANVSITSALNVGGVATFTGNPVLSGGTANGVLYLNASKVATSGSALVFDGTNLGIGTSSPATTLHVNSGTYNVPIVAESTDPNVYIVLKDNTTTGPVGDAPLAIGGSGDNLLFRTSSLERLRIDSAGNVGIGTTIPAYKLDVQTASGENYIRVSSAANQDGGFRIAEGTTNKWLIYNVAASDAFAIYDNTANAERLRINSSGSVGIGTSSPSAKLHAVQGTSGQDTFWAENSAGNNVIRLKAASGQSNYIDSYAATSGANLIFRTASTERMRLDSSGNLLVGTTSTSASVAGGRIFSTGRIVTSVDSDGHYFRRNTTDGTIVEFAKDSTTVGTIGSNSSGGTPTLDISANASSGIVRMLTSGAERARITSGGDLLVGTTNVDPAGANVVGVAISPSSYVSVTRDAEAGLSVNRKTNDGTLVNFLQDGTVEGSISVSGNTVSYNAFAGSHWSQLQDGSKPDILRGTVMESINELCVWPDETNERLPKSKISDTAGSKKVYGVFMAWDNDWTATNDMYITAVGAFICRVNGSVTVEEGDLLESNGDGTARVQADDIIRSSTIGKVTSTVKTHQYDDGSYCVPTVLYCG